MSTSLVETASDVLQGIDNLTPRLESNDRVDPKFEISRIELSKAELIGDLKKVADSMSGDRYAVVEIGYEAVQNGRFNPIVALRWAPIVDEGKTYSRVVRRVLHLGGLWVTEYARKDESPLDGEAIWETLQVRGDLSGETRISKLRVAMASANARIEDNRKFENGRFVGRPGIGKIK